ncbi:(2Fe-2S)-binding protein [Desulfosporosinus nitroreducens]|uniref:(2Fe-2S)-binding protein n=1 Tax=Desulfosporosinus nitroreducens TaxID=2018668 RepID=A0ABT8QXJ1_9FIRM|nr:(2Fe-2S)-binding protein [Desulfosporosinus nitroreducens]MCO1600821.1 (2Fe-2S)-binding protein [Desulfosporosinus nitroreducens]MDO0825572.1 (2Fe-2S)-binding protein [Desulfosporosinus nitroreducens]
MAETTVSLTVNGRPSAVQIDESRTLLYLIREVLGLKGSKEGCGEGVCGACTVLLDGQAVNACLVLAVQAEGKDLYTIEGLGAEENLHPLQKAFIEVGAVQCGYCTPGMIISAKALLDKNSNPSEVEIRRGLSGNLCRCTGYQKIIDAVRLASKDDK